MNFMNFNIASKKNIFFFIVMFHTKYPKHTRVKKRLLIIV